MDALFKKILETTDFQAIFKKKGYSFFTQGMYNVNLIGIRNSLTIDPSTRSMVSEDAWDDAIVVIFKDGTNNNLDKFGYNRYIFEATTDPGHYYLRAPISGTNGTAILVPGNYRSTFKYGLHKSSYPALTQYKPVTVWRDNNKDVKLDMGSSVKKETGMFGINIHRASETSEAKSVSSYSAGCQVIKSPNDWKTFMNIIDKSRAIYGDVFSYTLLELLPNFE